MDNVEKKTDVSVELAVKGIVPALSRRLPRSASRRAACR